MPSFDLFKYTNIEHGKNHISFRMPSFDLFKYTNIEHSKNHISFRMPSFDLFKYTNIEHGKNHISYVCIFEPVKTWHTERNVVLALGMALSHQNLL
jgi:hypothetical protein